MFLFLREFQFFKKFWILLSIYTNKFKSNLKMLKFHQFRPIRMTAKNTIPIFIYKMKQINRSSVANLGHYIIQNFYHYYRNVTFPYLNQLVSVIKWSTFFDLESKEVVFNKETHFGYPLYNLRKIALIIKKKKKYWYAK